jgi:uncharacterized protein with von Willebrand factor type A (vWA) domain
MESTIARFVHALRSADVPVSPAETLDALTVVRQVGLDDPRLLHDALSLVLAKTRDEKQRFSECFDRFFHQLAFNEPPKASLLRGVDATRALEMLEPHADPRVLALVRGMLLDQRTLLAYEVEQAARELGVQEMQSLRDKRSLMDALLAHLGAPALDALVQSSPAESDPALAGLLRYVRQYLREQVQQYVDRQYALVVDASGKRALLDAALAANLDQLPPGYYADAARVVSKLAERLMQRHRRQRRQADRGMLDIRRSLRENVAYDGALFNLRWRERRIRRGTVFVVCDLSGSVSRIARFLLTFLYDLAEALPDLRVFGFSGQLGEITELFRRHGPERAVEQAILDWGRGNTDYGRALLDLRELVHADLDQRSTLIFLGDARSNYYEPHVDVLRGLAQRVKQVYWLNPESSDRWGEGDSLMRRYAPYCLRVDSCARLQDIERFADRLLAVSR